MFSQLNLPEQGASPEYTITLDDQERGLIKQIATTLPPLDVRHLDNDLLFTQIALAGKRIPERLGRALINFRKNSNMYGTLLIRNLAVDDTLPSTPADGRICLEKATSISEYTLALLMMWLGEPIAYADEKQGALIQNICPVRGQENRQENTGSIYLEFHTEDGFHPFKPDFVGLLCLRADHERQAKTATASIWRIIQALDEETISLLREPLYRIRFSSSFTDDSTSITYSSSLPILAGDPVEPEICVDFYAMEALTPDAQRALETLKTTLKAVLIDVALVPGDLIIIDNRVVAHARTGFSPRHDGYDRWLQRMFIVQDFRRSRPNRPSGSHVCRPLGLEV